MRVVFVLCCVVWYRLYMVASAGDQQQAWRAGLHVLCTMLLLSCSARQHSSGIYRCSDLLVVRDTLAVAFSWTGPDRTAQSC
jgi:hypothetical protein